jgi:hypothetical protein
MYVLVAIVRKRLDLQASLYQTLQILSANLFEKTPISQALQPLDMEANLLGDPNQMQHLLGPAAVRVGHQLENDTFLNIIDPSGRTIKIPGRGVNLQNFAHGGEGSFHAAPRCE